MLAVCLSVSHNFYTNHPASSLMKYAAQITEAYNFNYINANKMQSGLLPGLLCVINLEIWSGKKRIDPLKMVRNKNLEVWHSFVTPSFTALTSARLLWYTSINCADLETDFPFVTVQAHSDWIESVCEFLFFFFFFFKSLHKFTVEFQSGL